VRDKSGCTATASITLQTAVPPTVQLGRDTTLGVGSVLVVSAAVFPLSSNMSYLWSSGETNASKVVKETGTYSITVTNEAGCEVTDSIHVCFCLDNTIYIPNVFQPNGGFYNDTWYILGNELSVKSIKSVQLMDSGGNIVFDKKDIAINDKSAGWNGTLNNKILPPGIFVYAVEVLYTDEKSEVLFGTVTIVR
jgi:gliding motility-associated-like protein